jgi:hypothetical protein
VCRNVGIEASYMEIFMVVLSLPPGLSGTRL